MGDRTHYGRKALLELAASGWSNHALGLAFGLTERRVRQVLAEARAEAAAAQADARSYAAARARHGLAESVH